jgi:CRP/FNR family transcriptional regulator, anaerobic regulatory protein
MNKNAMILEFKKYLDEKNVFLEVEEFNDWVSLITQKHLKRNEFLLRHGEVNKHIAFVVKGCLRQYTVDAKGKEHIVQFAPENWWISDIESFTTGRPSTYFIDAIEESDVLLIDNTSRERLMEEVPSVALFFQKLISNRQAVTQKRIAISMSAGAEERYLNFIETYRSLALRIPQHMIASYLGITPESLSRIRKQVAKK